MRNVILLAAALVTFTSTAALSASDPFSDGRANVELLLAKPGARELLLRVMPDIDTSLECFAAGTKALAVYAINQLPQQNAIAFGYVLALSAQAASAHQLSMGIDGDPSRVS